MTANLALGTMLFGTSTSQADAFALLDHFVDRGGVWIDTADCYAFWLSRSGRGDDSNGSSAVGPPPGPGPRPGTSVHQVGGESARRPSWRGWPANRGPSWPPWPAIAAAGRPGVDAIDLLWLYQRIAWSHEETVDAPERLRRVRAGWRLQPPGLAGRAGPAARDPRHHTDRRGATGRDLPRYARDAARQRPSPTPSAEHLDRAAERAWNGATRHCCGAR
jgi:hypothetical protein